MTKSDSIAHLAEALSKAQGAMRNAVKDSDNPFFKSKYADLAAVSDACRAELSANGLAVVQLPMMRDGKMVLEYVLMHSSGEFIASELEMTPVKSDPQGIGSAITYARRYTLGGLSGVATEDDDGNAASGNNGNRGQEKHAAVSFKKAENLTKSAAPNIGQGGNSKGTPQAADIPSTAREIAEMAYSGVKAIEEAAPAVEEEFCTREQQDWLRLEFKNALPTKYKAQSDTIRRDMLKQKGFVKSDGEGSSTMIPRLLFKAVAKEMVKYASNLDITK